MHEISQPLHKQKPPPCNFYYLSTCKDNHKCRFAHHYNLTPEQLDDFRKSAKQYPCPTHLKGLCFGHSRSPTADMLVHLQASIVNSVTIVAWAIYALAGLTAPSKRKGNANIPGVSRRASLLLRPGVSDTIFYTCSGNACPRPKLSEI